MELRAHQKDLVKRCSEVLEAKGMCYLAAEERVGKTLPALQLGAFFCKPGKKILVLTKKKALKGWEEALGAFLPNENRFVLINYEAVHKIAEKPEEFSFVILDEAHHGIAAYPNVSATARKVQAFSYYADYVLLLSATPHAESFSQLFHQFNMSKHSPFDHFRSFFEWFRLYGEDSYIFVNGRQKRVYNKTKSGLIMQKVEPYFVRMRRAEALFDIEPEDILHYVELSGDVKEAYKTLESKRVLYLNGKQYVADTGAKLISALHQIEGATLKLDDKHNHFFQSLDKIAYIKQNFRDTQDLVIFYNYIAEGELLRREFKNAQILQGTAFAEGIDLSYIDSLVIYSQNFSAAKYIQRRARQCNYNRSTPIQVHFIISKGLVSEQSYDSVAKKGENFTFKYYNKED